MESKFSEKRMLLSWGAFFALMFIPFAIAVEFWGAVFEDEDITDILAFVFLVATSYFSFRLIVKRMVLGLSDNPEQKEQ